jgi:hypothetical protein
VNDLGREEVKNVIPNFGPHPDLIATRGSLACLQTVALVNDLAAQRARRPAMTVRMLLARCDTAKDAPTVRTGQQGGAESSAVSAGGVADVVPRS